MTASSVDSTTAASRPRISSACRRSVTSSTTQRLWANRPLLPARARADQHMADRAVAAAQPGRGVAQRSRRGPAASSMSSTTGRSTWNSVDRMADVLVRRRSRASPARRWLARRMRPSASIQCRPTLAFSKKSLSSSSLARSVCSARRRSETSRNTSTLPATAPSAPRTGAALSSIGHSVPSRAIRMVWLARPTIGAFAQRPHGRVVDRLARVLVDDAEDLVERAAGRVVARPAGEALGDRRSATRPGRRHR